MAFVYEQANEKSGEEEKMFRARNPCRRYLTHTIFPIFYQRLGETWQLKQQHQDWGGRRVRTSDVEEAVLDHMAMEPSISTRLFAHEMGISIVLQAYGRLYGNSNCTLPPTERAIFDSWWLHTSPNGYCTSVRLILMYFTEEACATETECLIFGIVMYRPMGICALQL